MKRPKRQDGDGTIVLIASLDDPKLVEAHERVMRDAARLRQRIKAQRKTAEKDRRQFTQNAEEKKDIAFEIANSLIQENPKQAKNKAMLAKLVLRKWPKGAPRQPAWRTLRRWLQKK